MKRKTPVNIAASVRARLLKVSKERREDFTLTLMNYAAERFLYRLSRSRLRDQFILKGAMLFAVRIGEQYRATRDLDLLGMGAATEVAIDAAVRDIVAVAVDDDGLVFDLSGLEVHPIREDNRYGGIRAVMQAHLAEARIHVQIDVGFGDAITPAATDLEFPTLLVDMPSPNVLAYPTETIVAEKTEAMVDLGISNSRMKDFTDVAMAARRVAFDGDILVAALRRRFVAVGRRCPSTKSLPSVIASFRTRMLRRTGKHSQRGTGRSTSSLWPRSCPNFGTFFSLHFSTPGPASHSPRSGIRAGPGRSESGGHIRPSLR